MAAAREEVRRDRRWRNNIAYGEGEVIGLSHSVPPSLGRYGPESALPRPNWAHTTC
jgi:hypothetical protein